MQGQQQRPKKALLLQANSTIIPISDERIEDFMKDVRELTEAEMQKAPKDIQPAVYFLPGGWAKPQCLSICSLQSAFVQWVPQYTKAFLEPGHRQVGSVRACRSTPAPLHDAPGNRVKGQSAVMPF